MTVVWALTWLGQSAALAALTAVCVRLPACRSNAAIRHVAWSLALFLSAGLLAWPFLAAATAVTPPWRESGAAGLSQAASLPLIEVPAPVIMVSSWLGWAWAVGAVVGLALVARDVRRVARLKRRAVALTPEDTARLCADLSAWASSRAPRLAWCDALDGPALLGFFAPVIALPPSQVSALTASQFRLVMLHELAHVRRGDDWWVLVDRIALALMWVNPALHWVQRELSLSREMACDEWVVGQTAAPAAYARCLADVAGLRTHARRLRLAAGVGGRHGTLGRRVAGVLAMDGRPSPRAVAVAAWLAPAAVCIIAAGVLRMPPVFAAAHPPDAVLVEPASAAATQRSVRPALERPAAELSAPRRAAAERRAAVVRRSSDTAPLPAGLAKAGGAWVPVLATPQVPEATVPPEDVAGARPLAARALPGAGVLGATAPAPVPGSFPPPARTEAWWSGPAAIGGAAATGGRATASFFTRLGSRVPQMVKR